jgi:hypothetical protein
LYRIIAPWITENPLILHVVSTNPETVRNAIDQASNCGFEMISLSFGSGINMEDENDDNYRKCKNLADYADSKGLHLGGYSLLSSCRIQPDIDNIVNPKTGNPGDQTHGYCPALASKWDKTTFENCELFLRRQVFFSSHMAVLIRVTLTQQSVHRYKKVLKIRNGSSGK